VTVMCDQRVFWGGSVASKARGGVPIPLSVLEACKTQGQSITI
jgi:hypothetical protein